MARVNKKAGFGLGVILLVTPLVANYEGIVLRTYKDPVNIPTACVGETDKEVVLQYTFSRDECLALLGASLAVHAQEVSACVEKPLKNYEAAALLSWSYNVGTGAACTSTLMKKLNSNQEWCSELKKWVYAKGKVLPGLVSRRNAEYAMCTTGKWR